MNSQEKSLSRILFQNIVFKADGQAFEDLFTQIMTYSNSKFRKIEAWGNLGDFKNDGYIEDKGIYYQVYAPKDINKNYRDLTQKIEKDFNGLIEKWQGVKEYYFVINDKFNGVNPVSEQAIRDLKTRFNLTNSDCFTADNLERKLFTLDDDQIQAVIGLLPNPDLLHLEYSVLNEVVGYIMRMPLTQITGEIKFPEWDKKIQFNKLNKHPAYLLNHGTQQLGALNKYLIQNSTLAEDIQKQMSGIYESILNEWKAYNFSGDNIFWEIVNRCSPKNERMYQESVITIMAKYFESCDIFEEPKKD